MTDVQPELMPCGYCGGCPRQAPCKERQMTDVQPKLSPTVQNTLEDAARAIEQQNYGKAKELIRQVIARFGEHEPVGYRG